MLGGLAARKEQGGRGRRGREADGFAYHADVSELGRIAKSSMAFAKIVINAEESTEDGATVAVKVTAQLVNSRKTSNINGRWRPHEATSWRLTGAF